MAAKHRPGPEAMTVWRGFLRSHARMVERLDKRRFDAFIKRSQLIADQRRAIYEQLAGIAVPVADVDSEARS